MRRLFIQFATVLALVIAPMVAFASPLVSPAWLSEKLDDDKVVVIDLRNKIDKGSYETFLEGHIPGAIHSDYLKDGWRVGRDGVVGLLPEADQFQSLARRLGVSDDTHVVVVPAGVSSTDFGSAARAYWTFKVFGHNNVSILDGGFAAWRDYAPGNIETGAFVAPEPGNFVARFNLNSISAHLMWRHLPPTPGKRCWLMAAQMSNFMLVANIQRRQKLVGFHQPS